MSKQNSEPRTITNHLRSVHSGSDLSKPEAAIVEYFWNEARRLSRLNVNEHLKGRIDFSQIAIDSLHAALKRARSTIFQDRNDFAKSLARIIYWQRISAIRRETMLKRSAFKSKALEFDAVSNDLTVEQSAQLNNLLREMDALLRTKYDSLQQEIIDLGFIHGVSIKDVHEQLNKKYPGGFGLSLSNIRLTIKGFIGEIEKLI